MEVGSGFCIDGRGFTSNWRAVCWTPHASGMSLFLVWLAVNASGKLGSSANVSKINSKLFSISAAVSVCVQIW